MTVYCISSGNDIFTRAEMCDTGRQDDYTALRIMPEKIVNGSRLKGNKQHSFVKGNMLLPCSEQISC